MRLLVLALTLLVAACDGGSDKSPAPRNTVDPSNPSSWEIGPVINGRNSSEGVPLHPFTVADGVAFEIPTNGSVHYVTFRHGSLTGASRLVLRYRLDLPPSVTIVPTSDHAAPTMLSLYFQRAGDDWSGRGKFEAYRWFASGYTVTPLAPGEHSVDVPLASDSTVNGQWAWTAVETSSAGSASGAYRDALVNADRVGFVLGGGTGLGHGVTAVGGPARFVVEDFRVE